MLIICPTPIGNLDDVTPRQLKALQDADIIACEDSRNTGKLLELLHINRDPQRTKLVSYHEHNAQERAPELIRHLQHDLTVVLVSDAGTPTISDPGYRLVQLCHEHGIAVTALPGPVAAMVALSASGLPSNRFFFEGFLPAKQQAAQERLHIIKQLHTTTILYESPHKLLRTLQLLVDTFGPEHIICVARELTKLHEEYVRKTTQEMLEDYQSRDKVRGEFVILIEPSTESDALEGDALDAKILELLQQNIRTKKIRDQLSSLCDLKSSELYAHIEKLKKDNNL